MGRRGRALGEDSLNKQQFALWFRVVSVILVLFGILYVFFGLKILPVSRAVLLDWESALYGAIMMGWGVTLLIGLAVWLGVEAAASAWFGVWFNVGVDVGVLILFAIPLLRR
jgi:hypothetical protein